MSEVARREILNTEQVRERLLMWAGREQEPPGFVWAKVDDLEDAAELLELLRADRDVQKKRADGCETALRTAQRWHEALDYDEALNVIDHALAVHGSGEEPGKPYTNSLSRAAARPPGSGEEPGA